MIAWIAKAFKWGVAGTDTPVFGYAPGPVFNHPAQQAIYVTRQVRPWFSVIGPGAPILRQPPGAAEPAYQLLNAQPRPSVSAVGPGTVSGSTFQQALTMPVAATGQSNARSI